MKTTNNLEQFLVASLFPVFVSVYSPHTNIIVATRLLVTFFQVKFQKRELDLVTNRSKYSPRTLYVLGVGLGEVRTTECYTCSCVFDWYFAINIFCVISTGSTCCETKKHYHHFLIWEHTLRTLNNAVFQLERKTNVSNYIRSLVEGYVNYIFWYHFLSGFQASMSFDMEVFIIGT